MPWHAEENQKIPELYNLGPSSDALNDEYRFLLDQVFSDDSKRTNIALSGPYGAGKSSILLSYEKEKGDKLNFFHISLSRYESQCAADEENYNETVIEQKIVNQLLHQINPEDIPQSSFKLKHIIKPKNVLFLTVLLFVFLVSAFLLVNNDLLNLLFSKAEIINSIAEESALISILFFFVAATSFVSGFFLLFLAVKQWKIHRPLSKMKFAGNEIEFSQERDLPFFDKYLDEVLYLFDRTKADVIVFEDIDRFDDVAVFERLKEINSLLNGPKYPDRKKPVRFLYLVKDDIFSTVDRVKFFDTIIPVVPIVNGSNSYDKFIEGLTKFDIASSVDDTCLRGVSLHITDMRLVENICNEFFVYSLVLKTLDLSLTKLFALIVYKNAFPRDFSLLQQNKGYVYALFKSVHNYTETMKETLTKRVNEIKKNIEEKEQNVARSLEELRTIFEYLYKINPDYPDFSNVYAREYIEREKNLTTAYDTHGLRIELADVQMQLDAIDNIRFFSLLKTKPSYVDKIFNLVGLNNLKNSGNANTDINLLGTNKEFSDVINNPLFGLLRYLILGGYIDENYGRYLTYFYDTTLNASDMNYVLKVLDGERVDASQELDNPKQVASLISLDYYSSQQILNYDLVHYLLTEEDGRIKYIFRYLDSCMNYSYIENHYKNYPDDFRLLADAIRKYWDDFFQNYEAVETLNEKVKHLLVSYAVTDFPKDDLIRLNKDSSISSYISRSGCILDVDYAFNKAIAKDNLSTLKVKLGKIEISESTNLEMLAAVYETSSYELNVENVCLMYEKFYSCKQFDAEKFKSKLFTFIFSDKESFLAQYVKAKLKPFLDVFLDQCNECTDDEDIAVEVLNFLIDISQAKRYLDVLKIKILHAEKLKPSVIEYAIEKGKIAYSTNNLITLYSLQRKISGTVIKFINEAEGPLVISDEVHVPCDSFINALRRQTSIDEKKREEIINALDPSRMSV